MISETDRDVELSYEPRIAVIGIGGAGCNVVSDIYGALCPVDTIAVNTDKKALMAASADEKIYICKDVVKGEGTRGDMKLGRMCAQVHETEIYRALAGHDAVFIVAGLGGGTGTGAASVVAEICDRLGVMTFAVVIEPFSFEGGRMAVAAEGIRNLRAVCPNIFRFQNDRIFEQIPDTALNRAMHEVNVCIRKAIMDMIESMPGMIAESKAKIETVGHRSRDVRSFGDVRELGITFKV